MKSFLLIISFFFLLISGAYATHNRAGEITYEHVSGLRYRVKITTYTKASSTGADRSYLKIRWGDEPSNVTQAQLDSLLRTNGGGNGVLSPDGDVRVNEYVGEHTYVGPGQYILQMEDPNRNEGVLNISTGPGGASVSVMAVFAIQTVLYIRPGNIGPNNSVYLDRSPVQNACLFQPWTHNPIAIDIDGDELRYSLAPCLGEGGIPLGAWMSPEDYTTNPNDTFEIDPATGDIRWNTPLETGEYNIAIKIEEYRNGFLMGSVTRDMQITVVPCANVPPNIVPVTDKCVVANGSLSFMVYASDDTGIATFTAEGQPMSAVANVATFSPNISENSVVGSFSWQPKCSEVRLQPYQVSFVATDIGSEVLSTFETVRIRVVAPAVDTAWANAIGNQINLQWDTTVCHNIFNEEEAAEVKYLIYRRNNLFGFVPDECELGVPEYTGYTYIGESPGVYNNTYIDTNVTYGGVYCYMVVTVWPDGAQSYASEEFCDTVRKEVPVMTRVSVDITDLTAGADTIQWSKPTELDTDAFPGPYTYRLYHAEGYNTPLLQIYESNSFADLADGDTLFVHQNINTETVPNNYRVEIYSQSLATGVGMSSKASSVFITVEPNDNSVLLTINHQVPWSNYRYDVYRKGPGEADFSYRGFATEQTFLDAGLINNETYCYKVEAIGMYNAPDVPAVLYNWSQESCGVPYDRTPPCAPELTVMDDCENVYAELSWTNPGLTCGDDDVSAYNVYFRPTETGDMQIIATIDDAGNTLYVLDSESELFSLAGCYAITALDSLNLWPDGELHQNESALSNIVCIDNCPVYELPNIFTPNNDGVNDLLMPIRSRFIQSIEFYLYNRWGNLIFETTDPKINWNGLNQQSKELCSDGVYYYTVRVNSIRLAGITTEVVSGYVRLADGKNASGN